MITRFFSTSRPIQLVLVTAIILVLYILMRHISSSSDLMPGWWIREVFMFLVVFMALTVFSFFASKNALTLKNGYKLLFYTLFIAMIPETLMADNILLANLFIILALRRLFSLKSNRRIKKKLFDAGFWVAVASFFYIGSIFFFGLVFAAMFLFRISKINDWIIPLLGFSSVVVVATSLSIIFHGTFDYFYPEIKAPNYDFSAYNNLKIIIALTMLFSLGLWAGFFYVKSFAEKLKTSKPTHLLVLFNAFVAVIVILSAPLKEGGEFIFLFCPWALIMTNYLEGLSEHWFAEVFVWLLILTPVASLML
ncbi:MAG: hypothetical protein HKO90_01895 [Flavobacteriaceae bacterium]|nr:hypothetical protein [Flavobacteriaceae bacterium]